MTPDQARYVGCSVCGWCVNKQPWRRFTLEPGRWRVDHPVRCAGCGLWLSGLAHRVAAPGAPS